MRKNATMQMDRMATVEQPFELTRLIGVNSVRPGTTIQSVTERELLRRSAISPHIRDLVPPQRPAAAMPIEKSEMKMSR